MNYEAAIVYAHQRMREIGKQPEDYHLEPVQSYPTELESTNGYFIVNAFNEIYILVDPENFMDYLSYLIIVLLIVIVL